MPYANLEPAVMGWVPASVRSSQSEVRHIAILLFDGFSLLGAGIVAEVFHMANELSSAKARAECTYDVRFLSVDGGNVACSSSVRVRSRRPNMARTPPSMMSARSSNSVDIP